MAFLKRIVSGRGPGGARRRALGLLVWLILRATALGAAAPAPPAAEYQVKAAFLFNFSQFVEWPAPASADPAVPLVIAILGEDPFGKYLDQLVEGEFVGKRPIIVRRYRRAEDVAACHILFIGRSETAQMDRLVSTFKGRSILTVGDADVFSRAGGMVRFVTENGKIRLRINHEAAKAVGLTISSKILRSATIVTESKD